MSNQCIFNLRSIAHVWDFRQVIKVVVARSHFIVSTAIDFLAVGTETLLLLHGVRHSRSIHESCKSAACRWRILSASRVPINLLTGTCVGLSD